jgi:indolepyruvate decarboxylase
MVLTTFSLLSFFFHFQNLNVGIIVLNNGGYTIERLIADGSYNDIGAWQYASLPFAMGGSPDAGRKVDKARDLLAGLEWLCENAHGGKILEVMLDTWDAPMNLKMAGPSAAKANYLV